MKADQAFHTEHGNSLWFNTAPPGKPYPVLEHDLDANVVIVGSGFTGLRATLMLAESGANVVTVDAFDVGWGASGRNGGQVNPMLPFNSPDRIRQLVGSRHFELLTNASLNSADELFELIRANNIQCQARQEGWLRVDHCSKAHKTAWTNAESWNRLGADMHPVGTDDVERLSGSKIYQSGIVNPRGGSVHPLALARGLATCATQAGARIYSKSPVLTLERRHSKWLVTTPQARITTDWVVLATNGYSDKLIPNLAKSILPIFPIQIATDPQDSAVLDSILPDGHTISDTRRIIMYARKEPDNRMVFGGHGYQNRNGDAAGFEWLMKDAIRIYPQLKDVTWRYRWGGRIAVTDNRLPHFHEPGAGLIAGLGYNGRGVAMSHVMGRCLAERVLGAAPESLPFPVTTIKKMSHRRLQMLGEKTAVRFMRWLDQRESRQSMH